MTLQRSIDKNLREVEHVLLNRQASHRFCSHAAPLFARADILRFVDERPSLQCEEVYSVNPALEFRRRFLKTELKVGKTSFALRCFKCHIT